MSNYLPMAIIARFLTANLGLDNWGSNDCRIVGWKLINRPANKGTSYKLKTEHAIHSNIDDREIA